LQVATSQRPSAETSTPRIASPRAGSAVCWASVKGIGQVGTVGGAGCRTEMEAAPHLGILADRVKQPDVTLVAGDGDAAVLGRRRRREGVLAGVLLELGLDHLVAGEPGVDPEDAIVRVTDERLLARHLGVLGPRQEVVDGDRVVHLPLVDNLTRLKVHPEERARVELGLEQHRRVLVVEHDLGRLERSLVARLADARDGRRMPKLRV
jgi:hypothetical protein